MRTIVLGALNVVMPKPHRAQRYAELWQRALGRIAPARVRGDIGGMIGSATIELRNSRPQHIWGDIYKFLNIDMKGKWLDVETGKAADPSIVRTQVQIPDNLRPNLRTFPYIFYPRTHSLVFVSHIDQRNNLSPDMARTMIEGCLRQPDFVSEYGRVEVTVEPDRETLGRILALPRLKFLYMEVSPPNALGDLEKKIFHWMDSQNADKYSQRLDSHHPDGLKIDKTTKEIAQVAQSNGVVEARGVDERGKVIQLSTNEHPLQKKVAYDPKITTVRDSLAIEAEVLQRVLSSRREEDDAPER